MAIRCPTCNRSSDEIKFIGEFCEECIANRIKDTVPDKAKIYVCRFCNRIKSGGTFRKLDKNTLAVALKKDLGANGFRVDVIHYHNGAASLEFECDYENAKVHFTKLVDIKTVIENCIDCTRMKSGYYEALVQLRGDGYLVERMAIKLTKYVEANGAFISKTEKEGTGIDMYISNKKLVSAFFMLYRLKPKRSYTLYGMKHGKELYRNIYALRL